MPDIYNVGKDTPEYEGLEEIVAMGRAPDDQVLAGIAQQLINIVPLPYCSIVIYELTIEQ